MTQNQIIAIIVVVLAVAAVVLFYLRTQKSKRLRERFGPEYERAVSEAGSLRGEAKLEKLEKRVKKYDVHPLDAASRDRYIEQWKLVQARFVDDPRGTVGEADQLLGEVMAARGYPVADFEQQAADLSVNHAAVIEHYRAGHAIAVRHARGQASTEDLRQALIHYRELFRELVEEPARVSTAAATRY
jgi:transposase